MSAHLQTLIDLIAGYPYLVYGLVLLLALSESLPIAGAVIPGTAVIVGLGALVPTGALELWPLLAAATLGAVAGDGFSYWLGHRYHRRITAFWPFTRYPQLIPHGEAFFRRHGGKSVFLARFTPGVRAVVPLVAGIADMPAGRFYRVNIFSALIWAPAHVLPGALVGLALALTGAVALRLAVFVALLAAALWLAVWSARLILRRGLPYVATAQQKLWGWAQAHHTGPGRPLLSLLDPARTEAQGLTLTATLLIGALWLFAGILEDVVSGDPLVRVDTAVFHFLQELRTRWGDRLMIGVTELGDATVTSLLTVTVLLWLLWRRAWASAAYWLGAVVCAALATTVIKVVLHRARPAADLYSGWSAFSFPSGHTVVNATLYGFLAFLVARQSRPPWRGAIVGAALLWVAAIAFSRLYLGAHWASDVIAGLAFALAWVTALAVAYSRHHPPSLPAGRLLLVIGATLLIAGGTHVAQRYPADVARYAVRHEVHALAASQWREGAWRQLPARRIDLEGEPGEPFTVQWAGSVNSLRQRLLAQGWLAPVPWTATSALAWLSPPPQPAKLPVLPRLQDGQPAVLTLIRPQAGAPARLVLRLWSTDIHLQIGRSGSQPLAIGAVIQERFQRPYGLLTIGRQSTDFNTPRDILAAALNKVSVVQRPAPSAPARWDGKVLLLAAPELGLGDE